MEIEIQKFIDNCELPDTEFARWYTKRMRELIFLDMRRLVIEECLIKS